LWGGVVRRCCEVLWGVVRCCEEVLWGGVVRRCCEVLWGVVIHNIMLLTAPWCCDKIGHCSTHYTPMTIPDVYSIYRVSQDSCPNFKFQRKNVEQYFDILGGYRWQDTVIPVLFTCTQTHVVMVTCVNCTCTYWGDFCGQDRQ